MGNSAPMPLCPSLIISSSPESYHPLMAGGALLDSRGEVLGLATHVSTVDGDTVVVRSDRIREAMTPRPITGRRSVMRDQYEPEAATFRGDEVNATRNTRPAKRSVNQRTLPRL